MFFGSVLISIASQNIWSASLSSAISGLLSANRTDLASLELPTEVWITVALTPTLDWEKISWESALTLSMQISPQKVTKFKRLFLFLEVPVRLFLLLLEVPVRELLRLLPHQIIRLWDCLELLCLLPHEVPRLWWINFRQNKALT